MAGKLPVTIDNRGENKLLQALRRLLPNLQRMDIGTGVFSFLVLKVDILGFEIEDLGKELRE